MGNAYSKWLIRFIAENYEELRCLAEDGDIARNNWDRQWYEPLTYKPWDTIVEELADFDTALEALRLKGKFISNRFGLRGRDIAEITDYLNGGT